VTGSPTTNTSAGSATSFWAAASSARSCWSSVFARATMRAKGASGVFATVGLAKLRRLFFGSKTPRSLASAMRSTIALKSSRTGAPLCARGFARRGLARGAGFVGFLVVIAIASAAGERARRATTSTRVRRSRATSQERAPSLGDAVLLL